MNLKAISILILSTLSLGFIILNVVAYNQAYAMLHFSHNGERTPAPEKLSFLEKMKASIFGVNIPRPNGNRIPNDEGLQCKEYTISESNQITLGALYCPNERSDSIAILFHGYAADKSSLLKEAAALKKMGWSTLLVDFRGSGNSSEDYTTIGMLEAEDVSAAVNFAKQTLSYSRILLFGKSMGGVAILRAIDKYSVRPDIVIIEAVFDTMLNTAKNRFRSMGIPSFPAAELLLFWAGQQFNIDPFANNPVEYARGVTAPILFLHGCNDPRTHIQDGRSVFNATSSKFKQFKEFAGVGHEDYLASFPKEWQEVVSTFITAAENN